MRQTRSFLIWSGTIWAWANMVSIWTWQGQRVWTWPWRRKSALCTTQHRLAHHQMRVSLNYGCNSSSTSIGRTTRLARLIRSIQRMSSHGAWVICSLQSKWNHLWSPSPSKSTRTAINSQSIRTTLVSSSCHKPLLNKTLGSVPSQTL